MKKIAISLLILAGIAAAYIYVQQITGKEKRQHSSFPVPEEGEENEKLREKYNELRHRAAPGTNWKTIEAANRMLAINGIRRRTGNAARPMAPQSFANGAINGSWQEKGSKNVTGNVRAVDYAAQDNRLYVVSNGGSLWTSILGSGSWTLLNQLYKMESHLLKAFNRTNGTRRILVSVDHNIYYSDNAGSTLTASSGINFPVEWGGNYIVSLVRLNDASNTIYCLTRPWSDNPWGAQFWLYRSTDEGTTFSRIYQFTSGNTGMVSLCNPYNSNAVYVTEAGGTANTIKLYNVSGTTVNLLGSFDATQNVDQCDVKGTFIGGVGTLYVLVNNASMYRFTGSGNSWTMAFRSYLTEEAWNKLNVSPSNANTVFYGGVNAFKSTDGGINFTKINEWWEYYGSEENKLHADIMEIEFFKKNDNSEFGIVNCHGGVYSSTNLLTTVHNESLSSLVAVEYYDIITDTLNPNIIIGGSQDQGIQHTLTGAAAGIQDFKQLISGDYGHLCLTNNNTFLWAQYPGANMYLFNDLNTADPPYVLTWQMGGTELSNYGWMLPAKATVNRSAGDIWIGGGNINGGGGSYLAKATLSASAPYSVTATQFNYDFRANSVTGNGGVTAIEQSSVNPNKLYVGAEDGSFFYSGNLGVTWNRTASFTGPGNWYLYGSCILASKLTANTVWYAGSGYSNPPVYKSTDGGVTFTSMSNGLSSTLVNEIVASPDEAFLFAATEAGPYVYVTADNMWYPLYDNTTPVQFFTGVEYIRSSNTVRFSTMGRGIWDFNLAITYTFTGNGNWNVASNWSGNTVPPASLTAGTAIFINPVAGGECVVNIPVTIPANCSLTVNPAKKMRVNGNLVITR